MNERLHICSHQVALSWNTEKHLRAGQWSNLLVPVIAIHPAPTSTITTNAPGAWCHVLNSVPMYTVCYIVLQCGQWTLKKHNQAMSQIPCNGSCCSSCKKSCVALQYALWGCGRGEGWLARCLGAVGRGVVAKRSLAVGPLAHLASTKDQQHPACTSHHHQ